MLPAKLNTIALVLGLAFASTACALLFSQNYREETLLFLFLMGAGAALSAFGCVFLAVYTIRNWQHGLRDPGWYGVLGLLVEIYALKQISSL